MNCRFSELTFTKSVIDTQKEYKTREWNEKALSICDPASELGKKEISFINERDSFYIASVNKEGWPHLQHRGGPKGFVEIKNKSTLIIPDYSGNKQYITIGNLKENNKACLFFINYPDKQRLKILGHVSIDRIAPIEIQMKPERRTKVFIERIITVKVEAFDWNCSKHIIQRYSEKELDHISIS